MNEEKKLRITKLKTYNNVLKAERDKYIEALKRLASTEAFGMSFALTGVCGDEHVARIDYARNAIT
jgi:hypothetical protein